jgi:hypothetical protein
LHSASDIGEVLEVKLMTGHSYNVEVASNFILLNLIKAEAKSAPRVADAERT